MGALQGNTGRGSTYQREETWVRPLPDEVLPEEAGPTGGGVGSQVNRRTDTCCRQREWQKCRLVVSFKGRLPEILG